QTYTFKVENAFSCTSPDSLVIAIESIPSTPTLEGPAFVCVGSTMNVSPATNGTWASNNPAIATVDDNGLVTGMAPGLVILTFTRNSNQCSNTKEVTVSAIPNAPVRGNITQPDCITSTGSAVLNGLPENGTWTLV